MSDEKDLHKVIPLFEKHQEASIKQSLSEIYNAIYLLNLTTEVEGMGLQDPEIVGVENELQRDLISVVKELRGYAEKASSVFSELVKKHRLDYLASNK